MFKVKCACHVKKHAYTYFEPVGQGAQKLDFDGQTNECCHAAVRDGGRELNTHSTLCIINLRKHTQIINFIH